MHECIHDNYCIYRAFESQKVVSKTHSHTHTHRKCVSSGECRNIVALNPMALSNSPLIRGPINHAKATKEPSQVGFQPGFVSDKALKCDACHGRRSSAVACWLKRDQTHYHYPLPVWSLRILQICELQS